MQETFMLGTLDYKSKPSSYQPSGDELAAIKVARDAFSQGNEILHRSWPELNNRSVIDDENRGGMMMNAFVDEGEDDPNEAWKWRGTRSMARNKGVAMHAQITSAFLIPIFVAQNDSDEIDRDFSDFMRDIVEWMTYPENSDYQSAFLNVAFGMMDSPVTYMGAEYCEVFQKIRDMQEDGSYTTKEVLDEVLSGFKAPVYRASQVHITNAYERNMQKQYRVGKIRYTDINELRVKYGEHPNWDLLNGGVRSIYSEKDGLFYDVYDDDHPNLVEEYITECRQEDSGIPYLNGIYFGNLDDVENGNPIKHRDNRNAPKYNITPFGYHRIGRHFFYYKSMMNVLGWDNSLYDAMSEIVMNNALLEQDPPTYSTGTDKIDTDVNFPGAHFAAESPDFKVSSIFPSKNFVAGFQALRETEKSMDEGSISDVQMGQLPEASQKAYSVAQAGQAAKKIIQGVGKSLSESVMSFGDLMKDIAITHITVPQAEELSGGKTKLKYRSFLLPGKNVGGKTVDKMIKFDESLLGLETSKEERDTRNLELLEETGYPDNKKHLYVVNPELFAKFKYLCRVDLKEMFPMNEEMSGALWQGLFPLLREDPYIGQEDLRRKLLRPYQAEDLVKTPEQPMVGATPGMEGIASGGSSMGNMAVNKTLSTALAPSV